MPPATPSPPSSAQATTGGIVSVCRDAVYFVPSNRGPVCGSGLRSPSGTACPRKGDVSFASCTPTLKSHKNGKCVAPEDASCVVILGTTWGCVFPSAGCLSITAPTPSPTPTDDDSS
ncbi:hypothetical protein SPRG_13669, partial [Saprolegnia parasitica CBS 223.65]